MSLPWKNFQNQSISGKVIGKKVDCLTVKRLVWKCIHGVASACLQEVCIPVERG